MKKKYIIILFVALVVIALLTVLYFINNNYNGTYEIYTEKIDDISPDRKIIIKRNGKITNKYKYIIYKNNGNEAVLCYSENPVVNVFSLDVAELTIVLPNDDEVIAKLIKEEKWKRKSY